VLTLWDLIPGTKKKARTAPAPAARPSGPKPVVRGAVRPRQSRKDSPAALLYERVTRESLAAHGVRVRKWRTSMTGVAWQVTYEDGQVTRLIEAPRPRGPMSAAVFLHEIGHHAIGFNRYKPRCLEEYHAWMWSLAEMERFGVTVTDSVKLRVHESLHYAVLKAARRGLKRLPAELEPYLPRPEPRPRRRAG